jgi:hypothetical protein
LCFLLLLLFLFKRLQIRKNCLLEVCVSVRVIEEIFLDIWNLSVVPSPKEILGEEALLDNIEEYGW